MYEVVLSPQLRILLMGCLFRPPLPPPTFPRHAKYFWWFLLVVNTTQRRQENDFFRLLFFGFVFKETAYIIRDKQ